MGLDIVGYKPVVGSELRRKHLVGTKKFLNRKIKSLHSVYYRYVLISPILSVWLYFEKSLTRLSEN